MKNQKHGSASVAMAKFNFHGDELDVIQEGTTLRVVIRRVCEHLGIAVQSQLAKLHGKPWACVTFIVTQMPGDSQTREIACIDVDALPMWLATIEPSRVAEHVRPKLEVYQRECARVLADHFIGRRGVTAGLSQREVVDIMVQVVPAIVGPCIQAALAPFAARLERLEMAAAAPSGTVGRAGASRIKGALGRIARVLAACGRYPSMRSARTTLENQLRGTLGHAGTGRSWENLPVASMSDAERELDVMERAAESLADMLRASRQTAFDMHPSNLPN